MAKETVAEFTVLLAIAVLQAPLHYKPLQRQQVLEFSVHPKLKTKVSLCQKVNGE